MRAHNKRTHADVSLHPCRPIVLGCLTVLALVSGVACGPQRSASDEDDERARRVDALFTDRIKPTSPGCAVAVVEDGHVVFERGYGLASLELGVPITPTTVFNIASTSKQFTAASVALLAERGALSLDDDVRRFVPELPAYERPITIRHLVTHTSGLRDYIALMYLAGLPIESVYTDADIIAIMARQKALNSPPGEAFLYSNSGYVLLSVIVERATGQPFGRFVEQEIFRPLKMRASRVYDDRTMIVPQRATGYHRKPDGSYGARMSSWDRVGDGGVLTTVRDLARWDANFFKPVVGRKLISELVTPQPLANGESSGYAFGLSVNTFRGQRVVSHAGGIEGFLADMVRFPDQHFSVICLCNDDGIAPTTLTRRIAEIYLEDVFEAQTTAPESASPVRIEPPVLEGWAGLYRNPDTRANATVRVTDDRRGLAIQWTGPPIRFDPVTAERFRGAGEVRGLSVELTSNGFHLTPALGSPSTFNRVQRVSPSASVIAQYVGRYRSDELNVTYAVDARDGRLWLDRSVNRAEELAPMIADEFSAGSLMLAFLRDERGAVVGFRLNAGRVQNLTFTKLTSRPSE
ncbi:MAG: serine hydrolase domain-containing protein [Longimicrobiales bacterium]